MSELAVTVSQIRDNAQRLGLLNVLRPGTVSAAATSTAKDVKVVVDGDLTPIPVMKSAGTLAAGARVMVLFVEPHGAHIFATIPT